MTRLLLVAFSLVAVVVAKPGYDSFGGFDFDGNEGQGNLVFNVAQSSDGSLGASGPLVFGGGVDGTTTQGTLDNVTPVDNQGQGVPLSIGQASNQGSIVGQGTGNSFGGSLPENQAQTNIPPDSTLGTNTDQVIDQNISAILGLNRGTTDIQGATSGQSLEGNQELSSTNGPSGNLGGNQVFTNNQGSDGDLSNQNLGASNPPTALEPSQSSAQDSINIPTSSSSSLGTNGSSSLGKLPVNQTVGSSHSERGQEHADDQGSDESSDGEDSFEGGDDSEGEDWESGEKHDHDHHHHHHHHHHY